MLMDPTSQALLEIGRELRRRSYRFVTVTPDTHARVLRRDARVGVTSAQSLRDVFGWNRPFHAELLPHELVDLMHRADVLLEEGVLLRARVRFSTLDDMLFVHSAFPTSEPHAVFFGPDTYRFCALLKRWAPSARRVVDIGCGSGAGGLSLAGSCQSIVLADINERALSFARINALLNATHAECVQSNVLSNVTGDFDLVIANPPYMRDAGDRVYRDGGGSHGEGLSVRIVRESLLRLRPGGTLIVYTGSAVVAGVDTFWQSVQPIVLESGAAFDYLEIDPDVFGDELDQPSYEDVERIAAVGLRITSP